MLVYLTINGTKDTTMPEKVSDEFAELIEAYDFKDFEEVNKVLQWEDRCSRKNLFDWCPKDTEELKRYLLNRGNKGMMQFYLEFTNGEVEFFEAKTDHSAWSKAQKLAKQNDTGIAYLAESYDEDEVDRVIYQR